MQLTSCLSTVPSAKIIGVIRAFPHVFKQNIIRLNIKNSDVFFLNLSYKTAPFIYHVCYIKWLVSAKALYTGFFVIIGPESLL